MNDGVNLVYSYGESEPILKPGYYNRTNIETIHLSTNWSVIVFSDINGKGTARLCTQNTTLKQFQVQSLFVSDEKLSETEYVPHYSSNSQWINTIYESCKSAVLSLNSVSADGKINAFSGFFTKIKKVNNQITGYIVTACHCIHNSTQIFAHIQKQGSHIVRNVQVVGKDVYGDIAVLSITDIDPEQTVLLWGDSRSTKVGSFVCNIGFPLGMDYGSLSTGIVRDNKFTHSMGGVESVCTDIAIYSGCSGSPYIDVTGRVIGLISYGIQGGFNWGMSQHILEYSVDQIISSQQDFKNGYVGVTWMELTSMFLYDKNIQNYMSLDGIVITSVDDLPGLFENDIIVRVNNIPLGMRENQYSLSSITWKLLPGDIINIEFYSSVDNYKNIRVISVTLREFPSSLTWASGSTFLISDYTRVKV